MNVDMHFHTVHSDGAAKVSDVLAKIRKKGIGVAITDHNEISGVIEAYKLKKDADFIIPGIEVKSVEGIDILFYFSEIEELKKFFNKEILPNLKRFFLKTKTTLSVDKLLSLSKRYGCLCSVAHPFGYNMRAGKNDIYEKHRESLETFECYEVLNGGTGRKNNERALSVLGERCFTAGSDGHSIFTLGNVITCADAKDANGFLKAIRSRKNHVVGHEVRLGKIGEYINYGRNRLFWKP
jgi:predicted metal-dependent phosphoesterase TrpH